MVQLPGVATGTFLRPRDGGHVNTKVGEQKVQVLGKSNGKIRAEKVPGTGLWHIPAAEQSRGGGSRAAPVSSGAETIPVPHAGGEHHKTYSSQHEGMGVLECIYYPSEHKQLNKSASAHAHSLTFVPSGKFCSLSSASR